MPSKDKTIRPSLLSITYDQPQVITDAQYVFPASLGDLLPSVMIIPEEFYRERTKWNIFVSEWFFGGWPERGLHKKAGVDSELAFRHVHTILRSYEPKHEHKEAAAAWLLSRWFDDVGTVKK